MSALPKIGSVSAMRLALLSILFALAVGGRLTAASATLPPGAVVCGKSAADGSIVKQPASAATPAGCDPNADCTGCSNLSMGSVASGNIFYFHTGVCSNNPYINKIMFLALNSATKFRVYVTSANSVAAGTPYFAAGSSVALTGDSVTGYVATFTPGTSSALIGPTKSDFYALLYCDAPSGQQCSFQYYVDAGCTNAVYGSTVGASTLDSCMATCSASGYGSCSSSSASCTCSSGYTGAHCMTPPPTPAPATCPSGQTCNSGTCWTAGGPSTSVSCSCICSTGAMQTLNGATSCSDCSTKCAATTCNSGTSCSSSSTYTNPTNTGVACITYDPTAWLGTYSIASGCDESICCCAQTTTIAANTGGGTYSVTGTSLTGACGSSPPSSVTVDVAVPTSDTVSYTLNGQKHTTTRQTDSSLSDQNTATRSCSATLIKKESTVYDPSVWLGTYAIANGCDQSTCCCARTTTISVFSGSTYAVQGTNLAGQCGGTTSVTTYVSLPTSDTVRYSFDGQTHTATRLADGSITDENTASSSCTATLTRQAPSVPGVSGASAPAPTALLVAALAALLIFFITC